MQVSRIAWGVLLALASACAGFELFSKPPVPAGVPRIEFQNARFDGEHLFGRLLVGAVGGAVTIDARLKAHSTVHIEGVLDCATNQPVYFLQVDGAATEPLDRDLLTLTEGRWYGRDLGLLVFAKDLAEEPIPQCILARIVFLAEPNDAQERPRAEIIVRVEQTAAPIPSGSRPDQEPDAGIPGSQAPDAG